MSNDSTPAMLTAAFVRWGASEAQARVMAAQLWKRAQQLAVEHGISEDTALAGLLDKVAAARRGDYSGASGPGPAGKSV